MWRQVVLCCAFVLNACGTAPQNDPSAPLPASTDDMGELDQARPDMMSEASLVDLEGISTQDKALYERHKPQLEELAAKSLPRDASGLLGRNAQWGALHSPRFQIGAGGALRTTLLAKNQDAITRAFLGVEVAFRDIEPSGRLPSSVPDEIAQGKTPSGADITSGAAFFMGAACLGLWQLERDQRRGAQWIEAQRLSELKRRSARVMAWLSEERQQLEQADAQAPNRLLFDARTFIACGGWLEHEEHIQIGMAFIAMASALQRDDGVFIEGGGHDTSYQSVATYLAYELGALLPSAPSVKMSAQRGAAWLLSRMCEDGRVDSSQNKRTCGGGESFLGVPKLLSVEDVFLSLAVMGLQDQAAAKAAAQLARWRSSSPQTSCFESCTP